jgi:hypothetical protein
MSGSVHFDIMPGSVTFVSNKIFVFRRRTGRISSASAKSSRFLNPEPGILKPES